MKSVLYTFDMEPITIIELPIDVHQFKYHQYLVPVIEQPRCIPPDEPITCDMFKTVTVYIERLRHGYKEYPMFFVHEQDLINAFHLRAVPLVGQLREWEHQYKRGFMMGLMAAITGDI